MISGGSQLGPRDITHELTSFPLDAILDCPSWTSIILENKIQVILPHFKDKKYIQHTKIKLVLFPIKLQHYFKAVPPSCHNF